MDSIDNYANHSAAALAMELRFIAWVKWPEPSSDLFWKAFLERYPHQQVNLMKAREIVLKVRPLRDSMDEKKASETWARINEVIEALPTHRMMPKPHFSIWRRLSVAAIFLIVVGSGVYFLIARQTAPPVARVQPVPVPSKNDMAPGSNRAVLTLADGTKLVLDSIKDGTLATQGHVSISKLNGQIAYNNGNKTLEKKVLYNTVSTPRGGQYRLVLSDGTVVWLNAASSLHYPTAFQGSERRVEITGEAYFEVAHDADRPFIVVRGSTEVKVLGTHFNVNGYDDEPSLTITLLKGSVAVINGSQSQFLEPGQQAAVSVQRGKIDLKRAVNTEHIISWKNGLFDFDDDELPVIMRQLSRWYDAKVEFAGSLPEGHYTGAIRRQARLSEVLKMLETAGGVHFSINGNQILVEKSS